MAHVANLVFASGVIIGGFIMYYVGKYVGRKEGK